MEEVSREHVMSRYQILLKTLDRLRKEAPTGYKSYHAETGNLEAVNAARSRAYIHLLLKVYFGLLDFLKREELITDGGDDGGIDAYFIDNNRKKIYFIQSKFRTTEKNFEEKTIEPEELLCMDIDRITKGETISDTGTPYNSKILTMAKKIRQIHDISRYSYHVIILANARGITRSKLGYLTGGFQTELIDHQTAYSRLLFPLISGTFYTADELHLSLSLSDKNAGAKISYSVQTEHAKVEITVVFVPTIEIAKAMYRYRNSILKYNPRSFMEHHGQRVNKAIRESIVKRNSNEFALFNNGITMLSDETNLNERIGQKERAQLTVLNPQIINGGQTAYTLSQIYKETEDKEKIFGNKEVLLKIITFDAHSGMSDMQKFELIESISRATNSQTTVTNADRRSNEAELQKIQMKCFELLGIVFERKRGEFSDGISEGYINAGTVIDRNLFLRAALITKQQLKKAGEKKLAATCDYDAILKVDDSVFVDYRWAVLLLSRLHAGDGEKATPIKKEMTVKTFVALLVLKQMARSSVTDQVIEATAVDVASRWNRFREFCRKRHQTNPLISFDIVRFTARTSNLDLIMADAKDFFLAPPQETGTDQLAP